MADNRIKITELETSQTIASSAVQHNLISNVIQQNSRHQNVHALNKRLNMETIQHCGSVSNYKLNVTSNSGNLSVKIEPFVGTTTQDLSLDTSLIEQSIPEVFGNMIYARFNTDIQSVPSQTILLNAGTNWFNCMGLTLENRSFTLFVYLINNVAGVRLGVSRLPFFRKYSQASSTSTNNYFMAVTDTCVSTDECINIGSFDVVAGNVSGGYQFGAVSDVLNRPNYITKKSNMALKMQIGTFVVDFDGLYKIDHDTITYWVQAYYNVGGQSGGVIQISQLPFVYINTVASGCEIVSNGGIDSGSFRYGDTDKLDARIFNNATLGFNITGIGLTFTNNI